MSSSGECAALQYLSPHYHWDTVTSALRKRRLQAYTTRYANQLAKIRRQTCAKKSRWSVRKILGEIYSKSFLRLNTFLRKKCYQLLSNHPNNNVSCCFSSYLIYINGECKFILLNIRIFNTKNIYITSYWQRFPIQLENKKRENIRMSYSSTWGNFFLFSSEGI